MYSSRQVDKLKNIDTNIWYCFYSGPLERAEFAALLFTALIVSLFSVTNDMGFNYL